MRGDDVHLTKSKIKQMQNDYRVGRYKTQASIAEAYGISRATAIRHLKKIERGEDIPLIDALVDAQQSIMNVDDPSRAETI